VGVCKSLFGNADTCRIDETNCSFNGVDIMLLGPYIFCCKPVKSIVLKAAYMLSRDNRGGVFHDLGTIT
ncbi:unnamed protein product, partial [Rotaria sordida]